MTQKRGLKKEEGATSAAAPNPNPPKAGGKRGSRKVNYSIDLGAHWSAIDRLAALYGKDPATVVDDLTALYLKNSLSPHFAKLQSGYAQERREQEEVALREIAPLFAPGDLATFSDEIVREMPELADGAVISAPGDADA